MVGEDTVTTTCDDSLITALETLKSKRTVVPHPRFPGPWLTRLWNIDVKSRDRLSSA